MASTPNTTAATARMMTMARVTAGGMLKLMGARDLPKDFRLVLGRLLRAFLALGALTGATTGASSAGVSAGASAGASTGVSAGASVEAASPSVAGAATAPLAVAAARALRLLIYRQAKIMAAVRNRSASTPRAMAEAGIPDRNPPFSTCSVSVSVSSPFSRYSRSLIRFSSCSSLE